MTAAPEFPDFSALPPSEDEELVCEEAFCPMLDILEELVSARKLFPKMNSPHEGYAVLKEEFDELWEQVRKPSKNRTAVNVARMRHEATQVAAMALRFIIDCCEPTA